MTAPVSIPLSAVLAGWDRHNEILIALLGALPPGGLEARATPTSPTVAQIFSHLHHERLISVSEEAPEVGPAVPAQEWLAESDRVVLADRLRASAAAVRGAVESRVAQGRPLEQSFPHPVTLVQFLIFHEGYHHGQIKLALKIAGSPMPDSVAGPLIWHRWRERS